MPIINEITSSLYVSTVAAPKSTLPMPSDECLQFLEINCLCLKFGFAFYFHSAITYENSMSQMTVHYIIGINSLVCGMIGFAKLDILTILSYNFALKIKSMLVIIRTL